jgi:glycosyltransferase involved in cell wall biosynthesis
MVQTKQTVCLNMIVRNEARIIERCLNSVTRFIDHWVVVDTGSTDGTQQIIRRCMRNVPGELIERPWVDFAHNRSEALEFARGKSDYVLVIDADEVLVQDQDFALPQLIHDAYYLKIHCGPVSFWRVHLFRNISGWRYEGAVHEYLLLPPKATHERLQNLWIDSFTDGSRATQPGVYQRDVEQLLRAHKKAPNDSRTSFYLAQSYTAAGEPESALKYYQRCAEIGGWPEETWLALFRIAETKQQLQREWPEVLAAYLDSFQFRPGRAEPLYRIALHYRWQGAFHLAQLFLQQAVAIPYPQQDYLFVEDRLYRYLIKMALATSCYHVGQYDEGIRYCDELLQHRQSMPPNIYDQILINREQCASKAAEIYSQVAENRPQLKVFIAFRNSGHHLDSSIDRLLGQTCVSFEMVFLDLGSTDGSQQKIPVEDPRVTLVRHAAGESVSSFVARHCDENDVVLLLNGCDWLTSEAALDQLQQCFADPGCLVTYGQFQYADGAPGRARAIPDIHSDQLLVDDWRSTYPLAFRGSLLRQVIRDDSTFASGKFPFEDPHSEGFTAMEHVALARKLFAAAGSGGVRFNAQPICVYDADQTRPAGSVIKSSPAISNNTRPTISCLTVTLNRLVLLKEAIQCFCEQTYSNRELIIVTDGAPQYRQAIDDYLCWLGRNDIRLVYLDEAGHSLGALRNVSLDAARGDIVCQWDDDDLNHPQRLELQFEHMNTASAHACCFTDQLQFFFQERSLYWSDWRSGDVQGTRPLIPGTLMAHRDSRFRYPEITPFAAAGEDSNLLDQIAANTTVTPFEDAGFLNIYSYHGRNVYPEVHHRRISVLGSRSVSFLRDHESILRDALRHYRLPEPYRVTTGDGLIMFIQN